MPSKNIKTRIVRDEKNEEMFFIGDLARRFEKTSFDKFRHSIELNLNRLDSNGRKICFYAKSNIEVKIKEDYMTKRMISSWVKHAHQYLDYEEVEDRKFIKNNLINKIENLRELEIDGLFLVYDEDDKYKSHEVNVKIEDREYKFMTPFILITEATIISDFNHIRRKTL